MSELLKGACLEVARTNMSTNKPTDADHITDYQKEIFIIANEALDQFAALGACEEDVVDAVHYINQVFAIPPIRNNSEWFHGVLYTLLEIAFPNGEISGSAKRFATKMVVGIEGQIGKAN
ncbi:hypothetical protein COB64_00790 [Candidatus Wolfebacteria bacterium]|nr:MAG: hypothetical protein COB64_00790 [Candidatus Wolfebacteria bacterium]